METMGQNPTENDIRVMFKAADTNNDGRISFEGNFFYCTV